MGMCWHASHTVIAISNFWNPLGSKLLDPLAGEPVTFRFHGGQDTPTSVALQQMGTRTYYSMISHQVSIDMHTESWKFFPQ